MSSGACSPQDHADLSSEVFTVRHRAPEVPIYLPPFRPNTGLATGVHAALQTEDPALAGRFRARVYRALWVEGRDISEPAEIDAMLGELGVETLPVPSPQEDLDAVQVAWEQGPYDRRIPTLAGADGRTLLGLSGPDEISAFLEGRLGGSRTSGVCEFAPRAVVLIVGTVRGIWPLIASFNRLYDIQVAVDLAEAQALIDDHLPTVVLLHLDDAAAAAAIPAIKAQEKCSDVPVLVVRDTPGAGVEPVLFAAGAADCLPAAMAPARFLPRLQVHVGVGRRMARLRQAARVDGLTQVPNRRELDRVAELEWRRGVRSKRPLTVLMIDIDQFKAFNDHYGHLAGDGALRRVAGALSEACGRASDSLARFGGEEFAAVLPDTGLEAGRLVAEQCRQAVEALGITHPGSTVAPVVTVSIGVCTAVPTPVGSVEGLIDAADKALRQAKLSGRNRVETG